MTNQIPIIDSTSNPEMESAKIRFFDENWNLEKMQNAVHATINNQPADYENACILYKKKMLIQRFRKTQDNRDYYFDFRKIMETPVENIPAPKENMDYLFQLHRTCPDNQYICLFFFNTVIADTSAYGFKDCSDIFKNYAKNNIHTYTLCYLKKDLTAEKLGTIINNANTLGLNTHISVSSFKKPRRITENLYCVSSIIIDLDFYKTDYAHIDNYNDFKKALQPALDKIGYEPSSICYSGHGYYLTFNLERNINLKYPSMHWLYQSVLKKLIQIFEEYGADFACSDMTRVFKVPGSINFKTGNMVKLCYYNPAHTINLSALADNLEIHTRAENQKREQAIAYEKYYRGNKSRFTNVNKQRMEDFECLLKLRNYHLPNLRTLFFLFCAINAYNSGWSATEVLSYCKQLNNRLWQPLSEKELERLIFYLNDQLNEDGSCKVKYKNDHIVRVLNITDKEQESMHQLISCQTRAKRKKMWDKNFAHYKSLERKHKKDELFDNLLFFRYEEQMTNAEISAELDIDTRTITSYIGPTPQSIQTYHKARKKEYQHYCEESICYEIWVHLQSGLNNNAISKLLGLSIRSIQRYIAIIKKHHQKCC